MTQTMSGRMGALTSLTGPEMRRTAGGNLPQQLLIALATVGLRAFYEMGKQEGRAARQRMQTTFINI